MTGRKKASASKRIVYWYLGVLTACIMAYIGLGYLSVLRDYQGALYYLQWPMTGLSAAGGVILPAYLSMAKSDHKAGGITYDAAAAKNFEEDISV